MKEISRIHADAALLSRQAPDRASAPAPTPRRGDDGVASRVAAAYDELPAGEKRLADTVLEAAGELAGLTAAELAARADVSAATAVRFFRRLGYASYADARRAARAAATWGSPLSEWTGLGARQPDSGDFASAIARDMQNLADTAAAIAPADLAAAIDLLAGAERLILVGFRNSAALAAYACNLLVHVRPNVHLLPRPGQTLAEDLVDLGAGDVLVLFGFRRRPVMLDDLLAAARAAGAATLLIADMTAAGAADRADVALCCATRGHGMFDSYAAPISLINHLAAAIGLKRGCAAAERLAAIEALHARLDPMLPHDGNPRGHAGVTRGEG